MEHDSQLEVYFVHVWIREIHPMLWRRFLVRSDSTLADLHVVLQIGFDWTDFHLDVRSTVPSKVHVYEFKKRQERAEAARNASNSSEAMRRFDEDSWRIFRIKAGAPVGFDKVRVEAKNTKTRKAEATLKVIVLDQKTVFRRRQTPLRCRSCLRDFWTNVIQGPL